MNQLNQTLKCIQTSKATLKKQLENETDKKIQQKLEHQIHCLKQEETNILKQIGEQWKT